MKFFRVCGQITLIEAEGCLGQYTLRVYSSYYPLAQPSVHHRPFDLLIMFSTPEKRYNYDPCAGCWVK